jgi:hypothetical protein
MYYSLTTDGRENVYLGKEPGLNAHINLMMGTLLDAKENEIDLPYRYTMTVTARQEPRFYGWYPGSFLMQLKLVDAIRSAGVDNLQVFTTEIRREDNNTEVPGYTTVNIVGQVACVAAKKSMSMPVANLKYFTDLTIDPTKTAGQLLFRLEESPMVVLLHETVAKAVEKEKFLGLVLTPVKEAEG